MVLLSGTGAIKKKIATSVNPKLKISVTGDIITAKLKAGPKKNKASFKLGEEYDIETEYAQAKVPEHCRTPQNILSWLSHVYY